MDKLGRYYTTNAISTLLVNNITSEHPNKIIDLGIGHASLTIAAHTRWRNAKFFGTEIEKKRVTEIEKRLVFLKLITCDTLKPDISEKLKIKFGSIDIAICNPPYCKVANKEKYYRLFGEIDCGEFMELKRITSEIVFLAHNIKLLKRNGKLGIIVSDSLITGKDFELFRKVILKKFDVRRVIQLPDKIFDKTEAKTHIIFISKSKPSSPTVELLQSSKTGRLSRAIKIQKEQLVRRMDYHFFRKKTKLPKSSVSTLKTINAKIKRGNYSHKQLRNLSVPFFHSTSFKLYKSQINFERSSPKRFLAKCATKGDILLCRVGKRSVGKVAIVKQGNILISDCIVKICVPKKYRQKTFEALRSNRGQLWLNTYAHGVCSQVISKSDLINFPID